MNALKSIFSGLLLMSSIMGCVQSEASLPVYHNAVSDISLSYEGSNLTGDIKLDNGYVVHVHDYKVREDNVMKTWVAGDILHLRSCVRDDMLILSINREGTADSEEVIAYGIFDVIESPKSGLLIEEISQNGKVFKLNDGSVWDFSWYNRLSTKVWEVGDRVLVYGNGDVDSYEFINLDAPIHANSSSARGTFIVYK